MNQHKVNKIFKTSLGQQVDVIYVTSDDRVFIRWEEADKHRDGKLDPNTKPLEDRTITSWYPKEYKHKFEGAIQTAKGYEVKVVSYNSAAGMYLGLIADPLWAKPGQPYTSCSWNKNGKCINSLRPDCDLILED